MFVSDTKLRGVGSLAACRVSLPGNIKEYKDFLAEAALASRTKHPAMLFGILYGVVQARLKGHGANSYDLGA